VVALERSSQIEHLVSPRRPANGRGFICRDNLVFDFAIDYGGDA